MKRSNFGGSWLTFLVIIFVGFASYSLGRQGYQLQIKNKIPQITLQNQVPADQTVDFGLFWKAYDLLNQKYLDGIKDAKKLMYGAAVGLYNSLGDPYTAFLPPVENKQVNDSLAGSYEGIGAELALKDNQLVVVSPLEGSPAEETGLKAGDQILKIDGKETLGISLSDAVNQIRGPRGTAVVLTVRHELSSGRTEAATPSAKKYSLPAEIKIIRGPIKVVSLKWEEKAPGVAYVRLSRFGDTTNAEWDKAVAEILSKLSPPKAIILDVRGNPGGYFPTAIHVASEFIGSGVVSYQEYRNGVKQAYEVDHSGQFTALPALILIDKGSASASEIVAGALRDRRRFKIIGEKSFGKGTVQDAESFPDGSGVHITIARWLTPSGYNIHGAGIVPDLRVEMTDQDINNGKDPALAKALEEAQKL